MLGRYPHLVNRVVLVARPCDLPRWRRFYGRGPLPGAESPHEWLDEAAADAKIVAMTGRRARSTSPRLTKGYVAAAKAGILTPSSCSFAGRGTGSGD